MNQNLNELKNWLKELSQFEFPKWNELPELALYMDQVMTYLENKLEPLNIEGQENLITTWMINNYVKGDVVPNPVQKKYSKEHLSKILVICAMKQVLSIGDIRILFKLLEQYDERSKDLYTSFQSVQASSMSNIASETLKQLETIDNPKELEKKLIYSALTLAIEAEVEKIIANKILSLLNVDEKENKKEKQEEEKKKKEKEKKEKENKKAQQEEEKKKKERVKEEEKIQKELVKIIREGKQKLTE